MFKLPETEQEVFDIVYRHLIRQNEKSTRDSYCVYRNKDGLKCAAGALIPDEHYDIGIEGMTWLELADADKVPSNHASFIAQLQNVHDYYEPSLWKYRLKVVAEINHLNAEVLDELCTTSSC